MSRKRVKTGSRGVDRRIAARTDSQGQRRSTWLWIPLALIVLNLFVYAPVRHFEFVNWDDPDFVSANPNVLAGLTWHALTWAAASVVAGNWHPLTMLSHLLDVQMFGTSAGLHHVTSLLLHIANTLLLFGLMQKMTAAVGRGAFVAAVFAVHPAHVESVAWIAERKDVLSTLFWMLTLYAYASYVRRPRWHRYLSVIGLFALALMSKPMVVTLPFVLVLLDVWPLRRVELSERRGALWWRLAVEKLPLLALAVTVGVVTLALQHGAGAVASLSAQPWQNRVAHILLGYVAYLGQAIWPTHLAAFYPLRAISWPLVLVSTLALVLVTTAVIRHRHRHPFLLVGWLWYLITLAPVIGFIQVGEQGMADRYTYVPFIGLFVIVAWGVKELAERWRQPKVPLAGLAMLVVGLYAGAARTQVEYWTDSVTLWQHAASVTDANYLAYEKLAQALRDRGDLEGAQADYAKALALTPAGSPVYSAMIHNDLGLVLTRRGKAAEAVAEFELAVRLNSAFAEAQSNFGNALAADGRLAEAIDHYRAAVRITPGSAEAQLGLGGALFTQGQVSEALIHYAEAVRLEPHLAEAHSGLGAALAMAGREDQAMAEYSEALRLNRDLASAHVNLAMLLAHRGRTDEAVDQFKRALEINPNQASWEYNLALLLLKEGKAEEAKRHLLTALKIKPDFQLAQQLLKAIKT